MTKPRRALDIQSVPKIMEFAAPLYTPMLAIATALSMSRFLHHHLDLLDLCSSSTRLPASDHIVEGSVLYPEPFSLENVGFLPLMHPIPLLIAPPGSRGKSWGDWLRVPGSESYMMAHG